MGAGRGGDLGYSLRLSQSIVMCSRIEVAQEMIGGYIRGRRAGKERDELRLLRFSASFSSGIVTVQRAYFKSIADGMAYCQYDTVENSLSRTVLLLILLDYARATDIGPLKYRQENARFSPSSDNKRIIL